MASKTLSAFSATDFASSSRTQRCTHCYHWYIDPCSKPLEAQLGGSSFLKHCVKRLAKDLCPQCRQELVRTMLAMEKDQEGPSALLRPDQRESSSLALYEPKTAVRSAQEHTRYIAAKRDVKLYRTLLELGAKLPPLAPPPKRLLSRRKDTDVLLTLSEDRALFRELQRRGAFRFPGMHELFRDGKGGRLTDGEIYEIIRERGAKWNLEVGWIKDGLPVSFVVPNERQVASRGVKGRWNRRDRISGARPPARMDRGKFKLEPIAEVDEDGISDRPWPLTNCIRKPYASTSSSAGQAAKSFMEYQAGILHTFESTVNQKAGVRQLKTRAGTIRRVGKGSEDLRSRTMTIA